MRFLHRNPPKIGGLRQKAPNPPYHYRTIRIVSFLITRLIAAGSFFRPTLS